MIQSINFLNPGTIASSLNRENDKSFVSGHFIFMEKSDPGIKFNGLTILNYVSKRSVAGKCEIWATCKCDCGVVKEFRLSHIRSGHSKSCGCFNNERRSETKRTHGLTKNPLFAVWKAMISRCYSPKNKSYITYGQRGISVCDEWLNSHKSFMDWAMANGYENGLELDRRENKGNYEPINCRFITHFDNQRNTSRNIVITYKGETKILKDWAAYLNIKYHSLWYHVQYKGLSIEDVLRIKFKKRKSV